MLRKIVLALHQIYADTPIKLKDQPYMIKPTVEEPRDIDLKYQQPKPKESVEIVKPKTENATDEIKENPTTV